jgi:hypothetical protein
VPSDADPIAPHPHRLPRSLRQEYDEFIEQRIEEYKDTLPRDQLLEIGDEAVAELQKAQQLQLTELVLTEQVDAIIRRRLKLPSFRRWRERHLPLRLAQNEASHWGLAPDEPIAALVERLGDGDTVLVVGAGDGAAVLFLAARGLRVTVVDPDIAAVEGLETRAAAEALGRRIECFVEPLASWRPRPPCAACVVEPAALADLTTAERVGLVARLQDATQPAGAHVVMPSTATGGGRSAGLSSDAFRTLYSEWIVLRPPAGAGRRSKNVGFIAICPEPSQIVSALTVSE